jgi:hypothetical protein
LTETENFGEERKMLYESEPVKKSKEKSSFTSLFKRKKGLHEKNVKDYIQKTKEYDLEEEQFDTKSYVKIWNEVLQTLVNFKEFMEIVKYCLHHHVCSSKLPRFE